MDNKILTDIYSDCTLCPRSCHADRFRGFGFCRAGSRPKLARAALHLWEEPCLTGKSGAGAVFFSNCTLRCIYCQNHEISADGFGREISEERLAEIFLELEEQGAACIDLVTASHYLPSVITALDKVKHRLTVPVVYNCSGYESVSALSLLEGYIDIYLPDIKYYDDALASALSAAPGYFIFALDALKEMLRQTGRPRFDEYGLMLGGTIVRHMVLPGHRADSMKLLDVLKENFGCDSFLISIMSQYTPFYKAAGQPELKLNRRITSFEYDSVVKHAAELGFDGFMQEKSSAKEEYTPLFNLEGV